MRPTTDEPDEILEVGPPHAISAAPDECLDDRLSAEPSAAPLPGITLQRHRESHNLSLDDLARTTKISKTILRALEASDVLHLPAPIYTRGFVKAYASEVGLPPDETADAYLRAIEPVAEHHPLVDDGAHPALEHPHPPIDTYSDARALLAINPMRRFGRLATVAGVIGLTLYAASFRRDAARVPSPAASAPISDATYAGGVTADELTASDATVARRIDSPLRVELAPQGPCWVSIRVGGETVLAKLLQAGDRETIHLSDEAVVRVGEPGALTYSINGQSGRALGPAGTPVTVRISKDNFRDFLSS